MQYELSELEARHFDNLHQITEEERSIVLDLAEMYATPNANTPLEADPQAI